MQKLPGHLFNEVAEKNTVDVNIQLFKTNKRFNLYVSQILFKIFEYPENIDILKKYGKFIQIIDKLKDVENDYKYLPNIKRITGLFYYQDIIHLSRYPKIKQLKVSKLFNNENIKFGHFCIFW